MGRIILVTGGARSGKSRFAERYAAEHGTHIAYIATAEILDDEMRFRVRLHRERRPDNWTTFEAPRDAQLAMAQAGQIADLTLFDCLTIYTSNLFCAGVTDYATIESATQKLIDQARANRGITIFVTNEVGDGIVPDNPMAREYRDLVGLVNQQMGHAADELYLICCGQPLRVK